MFTICWQELSEVNGKDVFVDHWERYEDLDSVKQLIEDLEERGLDPDFDILILAPDSELSVEDIRALEIGRAIMEEADFLDINLMEGQIEHQLGSIYVNDVYISILPVEG